MHTAPDAVADDEPGAEPKDPDGAPKMTSFLVEDLDEVLELSD